VKFLLGLVVCILASAAVLALAHGPMHLTRNPLAVAAVLVAGAVGLCGLALIVSAGLRLATGTAIARSWWPSLLSIAVVAMIGLYLVEVSML
jgi:hypothetical protein